MKLPQLSLRELFLLVVIAAMGCGWWVRERQHKQKLAESWKQSDELKIRLLNVLYAFRVAVESEGYRWKIENDDGSLVSYGGPSREIQGITGLKDDAFPIVTLTKP